MSDILEAMLNKEIINRASGFFSSLDTADPRFLAIVVAVLVFIGLKMVGSQPILRAWGLRLGLATFLLYFAYAYFTEGKTEPRDWFSISLRSANAGGIVLALTWIVLPIVSFVYGHLRLALAAFLGYVAYALITEPNFESEMISGILLRASLAVALTLTVAWILHPIWDFFKDMLPKRAPRPIEEKPANKERLLSRLRRRREKRRVVVDEKPIVTPQPEPIPLAAPVTEVAPISSTALSRLPPAETVTTLSDDQRRRDRARLKVEILYVMAAPEIETRVPRSVFNDLVDRYLGDQLPAEEVEENSSQFELLFQQRRKPTGDVHATASLSMLTALLSSTAPQQPRVAESETVFPVSTVVDLPQLQPVDGQ